MSIASKIQLLLNLGKSLATTLRAKGVEASDTEGFESLVPKVSEIGGHITDEDIEWAEGTPQLSCGDFFVWSRAANFSALSPNPMNYIKGYRSRTYNGMIGNVFGRLSAPSGTVAHLEWVIFDNATSMQVNALLGQSALKVALMPNVVSVSNQSLGSCTSLEQVEIGALSSWNTMFGADNVFNKLKYLKMFKVGVGFDASPSIPQWTATNVIAEGEQSCLELINNARTGLYERVASHSGEESPVRTITAAWVGTLKDSLYKSVTAALDQLVKDFADKGWDLKGV